MANISKLNVQGAAYNLRDAASMHYIGHTITDIVPGTTGATITIGSASVTAVANDYVTSGKANLNYIWNGTAWELLSEAAAEIPVQDVKVNNASIVTNHIANIPIATNAAVGLVQAGTNLDIDTGVISVATATNAVKGVVQVGSNIDVNAGTISVPTADATSTQDAKFGVVKTGTNITNTNGVISVEDATDSVKGVVQLSTAIPATGAATDKAPTEKAVADAIADINPDEINVVPVPTPADPDNPTSEEEEAIAAAIAKNTFANGACATTQATSDDSTKIATTAYVHDLFDDIANPMIFKGGATLTADSTDPTTAAITVSGTVKKGYTYKITSIATTTPAYSGDLKVGDTLIADKDNPKVTADWVADTDWTVVPSGDENDGTVTSVAASAASGSNLTVSVADTETLSTDAITVAGSITVGIASGYQLLSDADKTKVHTIGTSSAVFNSVKTSSRAGTNSAAPAHVGDTTQGEDADTLYIDFLNFGTADVVGKATT